MAKKDAEKREGLFFSALRWLQGGISTSPNNPPSHDKEKKIAESTRIIQPTNNPKKASSPEKALSEEVLRINKDPEKPKPSR